MTPNPNFLERLRFLSRVIAKECKHLASTDQRLFTVTLTPNDLHLLDTIEDLAERVEAFVGRFGRLQDTIGDKLLPVLLAAMGEKPGAMIDNLDKAESLDLIDSADDWINMRNLRNQMVHEYVEDPLVLSTAIFTGHAFVPALLATATKMQTELKKRAWT